MCVCLNDNPDHLWAKVLPPFLTKAFVLIIDQYNLPECCSCDSFLLKVILRRLKDFWLNEALAIKVKKTKKGKRKLSQWYCWESSFLSTDSLRRRIPNILFAVWASFTRHLLAPPNQDCHRQLGILFDSKATLSEGFNRFANFEPVENNPCYNVHFLFLTTPTGAAANTAWTQRERQIPNNVCQNQAVSLSLCCNSTLAHIC